MGKVLGYGRISSGDGQDIASQKAALEHHGAVVVFCETGNGSKLEGRDQLEAAIRLLDHGDTLLALHPDRIARDTGDLLTVAKRVVEKGALLRIVDPAITFDGTDIMAEMMLTLFGLVGRVEKYFLKARQRRGIEEAKKKGIYKGRPASIDPEEVARRLRWGHTPSQIARDMKIGRASVYRVIKERASDPAATDQG